MPYSRFLGYDRGEKDCPVINEKEAQTVRLIFSMFLDGKAISAIASRLTAMGIRTPGGKDRWS